MSDMAAPFNAIVKALKACRSVRQIQRQAPMVQLLAVAKGIIEPADVRIGGTLTPQASMAFFMGLIANPVLSQLGTERCHKLSKNLDALDMTPRQMKRVAQGAEPADGDLTEATNPGATVTLLPGQIFATLTLDTLRDNADNPQFPTIVRNMINTLFANDLVDLAFNGTADDYAGNAFLALNKGFVQLADDAAAAPDVTVTPGTTAAAALTTGVVASDNAIVWTAVQAGTPGNDVVIRLVDPAANSQALAVSVAGSVITVSLATDGAGAITSTADLVTAAIAADANAAALVTAADASGSDGSGVVAAVYGKLTGGETVGWIDTLAAIRAASDQLWRATSVFFMSPDNADSYNVELGKHVTGSAVIANSAGAGFLTQRVVPVPSMASDRILYTPPRNLAVAIHDRVERTSQYHGRKRALEITVDMAFDFEIRLKKAAVLGKVA